MKRVFSADWPLGLRAAIREMLRDQAIEATIDQSHIDKTPERVVEALKQQLDGCLIDPKDALGTIFPAEKYDQMIHVKNKMFRSMCAHHLINFFGSASFAYMPLENIVGLSKIPRLIDAYAHRPQVQEKLTREVVDTFQEVVKPLGCGLVLRAYHFCMICRGVEEPYAYTETTALTGSFYRPEVKQEFLLSAQSQPKIWG